VKETVQPLPLKRQRCAGCSIMILHGEESIRLKLSKRYLVKCGSCGTMPNSSKWYHAACKPADVNKAMGYDPTMVNPNVYAGPTPTAAPPPKPKTSTDLSLEALVVLEAAVVARAREKGVTPEMEKAFKTFQGVKARVLRPGTVGEGEVATAVALKRIIDMVYNR
jgi:hypothetical protein